MKHKTKNKALVKVLRLARST